MTTPLTGSLRTTGVLAEGAGNITGRLSSALSANLGRELQGLTGRTLDQRVDLRGSILLTTRPILNSAWRLEPNLAAQVTIAETSLSVAGVRVRVGNDIKPLIDRSVGEQVGALEARLRADPFVEVAARREWAKMCRSLSLKGAAKDAPDLWLEMRPMRAFAAQPRIEADAVVVPLGVEAETRVVPAQTKPSCPFPRELTIVPELRRRQDRHRGAHRHAVHRGQSPRRRPAQGPRIRGAGRDRHGARCRARAGRRTAPVVPAHQGARAEELVRASVPRRP